MRGVYLCIAYAYFVLSSPQNLHVDLITYQVILSHELVNYKPRTKPTIRSRRSATSCRSGASVRSARGQVLPFTAGEGSLEPPVTDFKGVEEK